jgi:hypothetical protein
MPEEPEIVIAARALIAAWTWGAPTGLRLDVLERLRLAMEYEIERGRVPHSDMLLA